MRGLAEMYARMLHVLAWLLLPLRSLDLRLKWIETVLDLRLTGVEFASIKVACAKSLRTLGSYYHWKIEQLVLIASVKRLSTAATLRLIASSDETDYGWIAKLEDDRRGLLIAVPHHGHFVFSLVALAEKLQWQRPVFVFYDPPTAHTSNEIFDVLHGRIFGTESSRVNILHNNRAGISRAIKELNRGSAVVIMPDVYKDVHDTYPIPFCGNSRKVMLGTAVLARKTNSNILPLVSHPTGRIMGFKTLCGEPLAPAAVVKEAPRADAEVSAHVDYRTTVRMFQQFEASMSNRLIHWQYCRNHFIGRHTMPAMSEDEVANAASLFLADPRVRVDLISPIHLD